MEPEAIYTVGHSDHTTEEFLALLCLHQIALVVDVRSQPYSRWAPQHNRASLARDLESAGIAYRFMGDSLGGRPGGSATGEGAEEKPDYERMAQSEAYLAGIRALVDLSRTRRLTVMCGEGDHEHCHRHHLITQTLLGRGVSVVHIRPDGTTTPGQLIPRQLSLFG